MSSLARRTLRTTAAAAGIAALGAGLAGNAMAAPAVDTDAPSPDTASTVPGGLSSLPLAALPSAAAVPNVSDLPMLFVFQGPTVKTAGQAGGPAPATRLPGVDQIPGSDQVPGLDAVPAPDPAVPTGAPDGSALNSAEPNNVAVNSAVLDRAGLNRAALPVSGRGTDRAEALEADVAPASPVGALSALDSAGLFTGLSQGSLGNQQGTGMSTDRGAVELS